MIINTPGYDISHSIINKPCGNFLNLRIRRVFNNLPDTCRIFKIIYQKILELFKMITLLASCKNKVLYMRFLKLFLDENY